MFRHPRWIIVAIIFGMTKSSLAQVPVATPIPVTKIAPTIAENPSANLILPDTDLPLPKSPKPALTILPGDDVLKEEPSEILKPTPAEEVLNYDGPSASPLERMWASWGCAGSIRSKGRAKRPSLPSAFLARRRSERGDHERSKRVLFHANTLLG